MYENVERRLTDISIKYGCRSVRDTHIINSVFSFAVVACVIAGFDTAPKVMKDIGYCVAVYGFLQALLALLWFVHNDNRADFFKMYFMVMAISVIGWFQIGLVVLQNLIIFGTMAIHTLLL